MEHKYTKPTMKQVAAYAGVSTATVARFIHKNGYISADAEQKVKEAIQATGYHINAIAQSLRQQRTNTIAHILESAMPNPFFIHVSLGAKAMAHENDYHILEYNVQHDPAIEKRAVEAFISRRVDAILFTVPLDMENVHVARLAGIPVVQIEKPCTPDTSVILVDNYIGAQAAINHLVDLGHRRIAFIGTDPNTLPGPSKYASQERLDAYVETLNHRGLEIDETLIAFGESYSTEAIVSVGSGVDLTHRLLDLAQPPTAIFAAADNIAAGVMQVIYERGLRVPDDISVIGFDDTYSPYLAPPLTTVKMPMYAMGSEGVRLALAHIAHLDNGCETWLPQTLTLKTELVVRQSTAVPRASVQLRSHV